MRAAFHNSQHLNAKTFRDAELPQHSIEESRRPSGLRLLRMVTQNDAERGGLVVWSGKYVASAPLSRTSKTGTQTHFPRQVVGGPLEEMCLAAPPR